MSERGGDDRGTDLRASSACTIASWHEETLTGEEGEPRLTQVSVRKLFKGEFEGESRLEYLMAYTRAGSAGFVGIEGCQGRLGGQPGSFLLQHAGVFSEVVAQAQPQDVLGTGTGDMRGLSGEGSFSLSHAAEYEFQLDYDLPWRRGEALDRPADIVLREGAMRVGPSLNGSWMAARRGRFGAGQLARKLRLWVQGAGRSEHGATHGSDEGRGPAGGRAQDG